MKIADLDAEEKHILARLEKIKLEKHRLSELTPNAKTIAAFKEVEAGGGEVFKGPAAEIHDDQ